MMKVVVLGAGFGGLRAAILLAKRIKRKKIPAELVLIDKNAYHTYTPTLYEAATTSKETANYLQLKEIVTIPIEEIIRGLPIRFIHDTVTSIDLINGDIHCGDIRAGETLKFDYLVLAPGSETNYFDIPGLKENSLPLKNFTDALKIRDAIFDLAQVKKEIKILIGGGGSTGVELAGEISNFMCELQKEIQECVASIAIIEGAPTILSGFPEKIIKKVQKRLKKLDVEVVNNELISEVKSGLVNLKSGKEMPYDLLLWTGGVKAPALLGNVPLKLEKKGRIEVVGVLECLPQSPDLKLYGKIYGIGDAVCFYDLKTGKPIPGVARAAISQANVVAHNIMCDLQNRPDHKTYKPMDYPYIIPVGGKWAVAKVGPVIISGIWGWILKGLVELNYLRSILPFWKTIRTWLKGLRIFIQNDRLG